MGLVDEDEDLLTTAKREFEARRDASAETPHSVALMEKLPPPLRPGNPSTFAKMARIKTTFAALVLAQAAHSVEEYGHPLWSLRQGGYTPGVFTALVLLALAPYLAAQPRKITTSATS